MTFQLATEAISGIGHFLNLTYSYMSLTGFELSELRSLVIFLVFVTQEKKRKCFTTQCYFLHYGVVFVVKCPNDLTERKIWAVVAGGESIIKRTKEFMEVVITTF